MQQLRMMATVEPHSFPPPFPKQGWKMLRVEVPLLGLLWLESLRPAAGTFTLRELAFWDKTQEETPGTPRLLRGESPT